MGTLFFTSALFEYILIKSIMFLGIFTAMSILFYYSDFMHTERRVMFLLQVFGALPALKNEFHHCAHNLVFIIPSLALWLWFFSFVFQMQPY